MSSSVLRGTVSEYADREGLVHVLCDAADVHVDLGAVRVAVEMVGAEDDIGVDGGPEAGDGDQGSAAGGLRRSVRKLFRGGRVRKGEGRTKCERDAPDGTGPTGGVSQERRTGLEVVYRCGWRRSRPG